MAKPLLYFFMFLHIIFAAGTYIFCKAAAVEFPGPASLTSFRGIGTMIIFLLLSGRFIPKPTFSKIEWLKIVILGILLVPLNQYCFLYGLQYTVPSHPALFYALTPGGVLILSSMINRKKPGKIVISGVIFSLLGVIIILRPWESTAFATELRTGDFWILLAVFTWILYTVLAGPICKKHDVKTVTSWSLIAGGLLMSPVAVYSVFSYDFSRISWPAWFSLGWMIVITSTVMMLLWNILLRDLETVQVAISTNAQPPATALLSLFFAWAGILDSNQDINFIFIIGMLMVLSGLLILQKFGYRE